MQGPASAEPATPAAPEGVAAAPWRGTGAPATGAERPGFTALPGASQPEPRTGTGAELPRTSLRTSKAAPPAPSGPDPALLERAQEILRQIELHLTPGVKRLTLDLEPAELGRLSIQLALRHGKVTAILRGEREETVALLAGGQDELRQVLARQGIVADSIRFEHGFTDRRPRSGARQDAPDPRSARALPPSAAPSPTPRRSTSLVDTYA